MKTLLDVQQERTEKGDLRYPTRYFAVWRDGPDGPLPYHQDTDSYCDFTHNLAIAARLSFSFGPVTL
jgi:hypothetical protein